MRTDHMTGKNCVQPPLVLHILLRIGIAIRAFGM